MTGMEEVNPYAAPQHDLPLDVPAVDDSGGIWRDGDLLVIRKGAVMPDRCVICNAPAGGRRLTFAWLEPTYLLGVRIPMLKEYAQIPVGICRRHRWRRWRAMAASWLAVLLSLISILSWNQVIDIRNEHWLIILLYAICGISLIPALVCASIFSTPPVRPHRADRNCVWVKKVHPEYVAGFPPWR